MACGVDRRVRALRVPRLCAYGSPGGGFFLSPSPHRPIARPRAANAIQESEARTGAAQAHRPAADTLNPEQPMNRTTTRIDETHDQMSFNMQSASERAEYE